MSIMPPEPGYDWPQLRRWLLLDAVAFIIAALFGGVAAVDGAGTDAIQLVVVFVFFGTVIPLILWKGSIDD